MDTLMENKEELSAAFYAVTDTKRGRMLLWRSTDEGCLSFYHTAPMTTLEREVFLSMRTEGLRAVRNKQFQFNVYDCVRWYHDYMVVKSNHVTGDDCYRVVNTQTGEESMLYTVDQCIQIIMAARDAMLKGSFGMPHVSVAESILPH